MDHGARRGDLRLGVGHPCGNRVETAPRLGDQLVCLRAALAEERMPFAQFCESPGIVFPLGVEEFDTGDEFVHATVERLQLLGGGTAARECRSGLGVLALGLFDIPTVGAGGDGGEFGAQRRGARRQITLLLRCGIPRALCGGDVFGRDRIRMRGRRRMIERAADRTGVLVAERRGELSGHAVGSSLTQSRQSRLRIRVQRGGLRELLLEGDLGDSQPFHLVRRREA